MLFFSIPFIRNKCSFFYPYPSVSALAGGNSEFWSEKNSDQNSDHPRLCIYWGNEKLRPWSEFLGRENSDHGLSFGCFWGRGRRGGSQGKKKAHKHKSFWPVTPPVTGGSPDRESRGQSFMYCPRNPRNINLFVRYPTGRTGDRGDRKKFYVQRFFFYVPLDGRNRAIQIENR